MTLREEVLKNAGLLDEATLEEGKLGKVLSIAAIIGLIATAAIKGPAIKNEYDKYKYVSSKSATTKYHEADRNANRNLANWEGNVSIYTSHKVGSGDKQPILNIDVRMEDYVRQSLSGDKERTAIAEDIQSIILKQLDAYIESIKSNSSEIERLFSKGTYVGNVKPLKVQLDFVADVKRLAKFDESKISVYGEEAEPEFKWLSKVVGMVIDNAIARKLGINVEYVDIFVNGKSTAFKK